MNMLISFTRPNHLTFFSHGLSELGIEVFQDIRYSPFQGELSTLCKVQSRGVDASQSNPIISGRYTIGGALENLDASGTDGGSRSEICKTIRS